MAFGIPNSGGGSDSGPFLGRIQYDARVGFFTRVDRVLDGDVWNDHKSEPFRGPVFAIDFGSLEVGYFKLASPPVFLMAPYGQPIPPQPEETVKDDKGKERRAFSPGFRVKVMSAKTFKDPEPRFFSHNARGVMDAMEGLFMAFSAAPEAAEGMIPVVEHTDTKKIETVTKFGTNTNYAPVFTIKQWITRPAGFGERTVPAPVQTQALKPQPAPVAQPAKPAPQPVAAGGDDDMPF